MGAMIALAAVWLVFAVGGNALGWLVPHLIMTPRTALGREPWQLVTNGFIETDFIDLLLTAVMLIFFGNPLEQRQGAGGFWKVFLGGIVGGSLVAAIVGRLVPQLGNTAMAGAQPATTALLVAFGALWAGQAVRAYGVAQMSATTMTWIFVGINALSYLRVMRIDWRIGVLGLCAMSGAALAGWLLARRGGIDIGGSIDKMRMWRLKRRYRVLTGGRDSREDKRWLN
jgi:membrane associated rhomboid family serine protease